MSLLKAKPRLSFTKNRVTKFLTYAIGEIFLVVIGILLAVEINTWNEARKDRETEQSLLKGLLIEMKGNRDELVKTMAYHERSQHAAKKIMQIYQSDFRQFKGNVLDSTLAEVQWCWTFDPRLGVLNSIKNTGKINVIQNPEIQSFITSFEEVANDSREESLTIKSLINTSASMNATNTSGWISAALNFLRITKGYSATGVQKVLLPTYTSGDLTKEPKKKAYLPNSTKVFRSLKMR
jgi:hypothetical protein